MLCCRGSLGKDCGEVSSVPPTSCSAAVIAGDLADVCVPALESLIQSLADAMDADERLPGWGRCRLKR